MVASSFSSSSSRAFLVLLALASLELASAETLRHSVCTADKQVPAAVSYNMNLGEHRLDSSPVKSSANTFDPDTGEPSEDNANLKNITLKQGEWAFFSFQPTREQFSFEARSTGLEGVYPEKSDIEDVKFYVKVGSCMDAEFDEKPSCPWSDPFDRSNNVDDCDYDAEAKKGPFTDAIGDDSELQADFMIVTSKRSIEEVYYAGVYNDENQDMIFHFAVSENGASQIAAFVCTFVALLISFLS